MADANSYQQSLIDAGQACAQAVSASVQAALVMAGLFPPPEGMEKLAEGRTLADAGSLASTAAQAAGAAHDIAQALDLLQARPLKNPAGVVPDLYPATTTPTSTP